MSGDIVACMFLVASRPLRCRIDRCPQSGLIREAHCHGLVRLCPDPVRREAEIRLARAREADAERDAVARMRLERARGRGPAAGLVRMARRASGCG